MSENPAGQSWSARSYADNARFVADLGLPVVELLAPRIGERILDLGCGDGALTERIAALGPHVVGIDASPELVDAARARGLDVALGDAHELGFEAEFDAVFSNAALHWMLRPDAVVLGVVHALRPGGRFVGEMGGFGNVAAISLAMRTVLLEAGVDGLAIRPWYFPSPREYRRLLEVCGFQVDMIELIPRPTPLPTGMAGWLETFGEPFLRHIPPASRPRARARAVELLSTVLRDDDGAWFADYVRLRFRATKPREEGDENDAS